MATLRRIWAIGMFSKARSWRWLCGVVVLAAAECATVVAIDIAFTTPAQAQYRDDRYPFLRRPRQRSEGGFFQQLFGGGGRGYEERAPVRKYRRAPAPRTDFSRAPAVHKSTSKEAAEATTSIVVMGDSMADWLSYGLEEAFADSPEIAVVRKDKPYSGLIRYEHRSDLDWWHVARDILSQQKANYVVMMLGVSDRQNIRERDVAKEKEKNEQQQQQQQDQNAENRGKTDNADQPNTAAPEPKADPKPAPKRSANGVIEFRTERWATVYSRRIDETIAALKSKGVPVFWVGLPSIRGSKSTADAVYLNDLFRARAERAGIVYIDIWDGFVDEAGKYSSFGPDYEGQTRRLRAGDGVYFTKYGARKLAHYVEREIRRHMNNRALPVALPSGPLGPLPGDGQSAARPLAGPVVPLTVTPGNVDVLAGGAGTHGAHGDALATQVLVKGEPVSPPPGRADDYAWPPGSNADKTKTPAASPVASAGAAAAAATPAAAPAIVGSEPAQPVRTPAERTTQSAPAKPKPPADVRQPPPQTVPQRRSQSIFGPDGPFGWIR